jgi:hypothetical protein
VTPLFRKQQRPPRFGAPVRWTLRALALVVVLWLIASVFMLVQARSNAVRGLDRLDAVRQELTATELLRGGGQAELAAARRDFERAHDRANSVVLAPWKVIPLVSGNVRSTERITAAAARVADVAERAAAQTAEVLKATPATGAERLALLDQMVAITGKASRRLRRIDLGPDFLLVQPLGAARERFLARLSQLREALRGAEQLAAGARQLLQGPRRYLLLAANNGEMRAGSGMLLSVGVATFANGNFSIGELRPTPEFNLPPGAVTLPAELEQLWGWLHPGEEWRNLATSPRFDVTAPLAADMWQASTGEQVDGVLAVDALALRALLAAQGPIDVASINLGADNLLSFLLVDQYVGVDVNDPQAGRRDLLGAVASAALDTLDTRGWQSADLVGELGGAGHGRHVLAWARDPVEQEAWAAGGVDGALHEDSLAVSLLNVGGNKLDQFVNLDARLEVGEVGDGGHAATLTLTIRNDAPTGLPAYVAGPHPSTDLAEGEYQGIVEVNTPGVGSLPRIEGLEPLLASGLDGPTKVAAAGYVRLLRGTARTVTVHFLLPKGFDSLLVESSARTPPIRWHFNGRTWTDEAPEHAEW